MVLLRQTIGFVYVVTNDSMPDIVKVGFTSWLPEDRAKDLYTTGVPEPFKVRFRLATSRPEAVEGKAHELLDAHRTNTKREFFRVSVNRAIEAVRLAAIEAAGIASWKSPQPYRLKTGDRLALTLEAGQSFALLSYKSLFSPPEPIDFWQAHSHGDLLEIFGTESPHHVAGFSDLDPGGTDDPVPYLDREGTVANGMINGRERIMPGERLVWLPAPEESESQASVVIEADAYCQVVSRTWSPRMAPGGLPLLLNHFTHTDVWPAADRSVRDAMALPLPRSWEPRENRDASWAAAVGLAPPAADHWLPQLKPRGRTR
jgi:hypothetical protein